MGVGEGDIMGRRVKVKRTDSRTEAGLVDL